MAYNYGAAGPNANLEINALFSIEVDGLESQAFEKCSLGDSEWNVIEDRSGIDGITKNTVSGLKNVRTITLEKHLRVDGIDDVKELYDWHTAGSGDKRTGSVVALNRDKEEIARFNFERGWISKISGPEFDAGSDNEPILFSIEITVPELIMVT